MRLWADCLNTETKVGATTACGNVNLCAGLRAGIEGNLHAVRAVWPQSAGWERDGGEVTAPMPVTEGTSMAVTRATTLAKLLTFPDCVMCRTVASGPHFLTPRMASTK
jgi:hypothetical protein